MTTAPFQATVNFSIGFGVQGEIVYDGPVRSNPWQLISTPQANIIGATAYTIASGPTGLKGDNCGIAAAGGTGVFAGILANPKVYANFGVLSVATLTLPDDTVAELITMGQMLVKLTTAANPGDIVVFDNTTGALSSVPGNIAYTASFATSVMTVTVAPTTGAIGVGSLVNAASVAPGTFVTSLGTGTGGTGTYNLSTSPGTIAAEAVTTPGGSSPGAGKTVVPRCKTILRPSAANALAIIELTD
jgi:hypothetical protein